MKVDYPKTTTDPIQHNHSPTQEPFAKPPSFQQTWLACKRIEIAHPRQPLQDSHTYINCRSDTPRKPYATATTKICQ